MNMAKSMIVRETMNECSKMAAKKQKIQLDNNNSRNFQSGKKKKK